MGSMKVIVECPTLGMWAREDKLSFWYLLIFYLFNFCSLYLYDIGLFVVLADCPINCESEVDSCLLPNNKE